MAKNEKYHDYAAIICGKIYELFDEDSESNFKINLEEINEGDNAIHFFHALANIMPTHIFNKFTGENKNNLEFNHLANHLIFQYSKKTED